MDSGREHPDEPAVIAFAKTILTQEYFKLYAAWLKKEYPGSCAKVLPKLRVIWGERFR